MIEYFGPGEHSAGFIGFQVTATVGGKVRKKMFSTASASDQHSSNFTVQYRWLCAMECELTWSIEAHEVRYRKLISENHHLTLPGRGLGLQCLTASFVPSGEDWIPCFLVARRRDEFGRRQGPKRFYFKEMAFSDAWREAVHFWADEHTVFDEDRDRIAANPPRPELFTALRRQMNGEGRDIPPSATADVFAEQRNELAQARAAGAMPEDVEKALLSEVATWTERQQRHLKGQKKC